MTTKSKGYCDLNISIGPKTRQVCESAIELGYKTLAINTPVVAKDCLAQYKSTGKKGGKKRKFEERSGGTLSSAVASLDTSTNGLPSPPTFDWIESLIKDHPDIRILQRLTVIFSDVSDLQAVLALDKVRLYDILSVVPTNHEALQTCITSNAVAFDMISFDFEGPYWINKIKLNRQKGNLAMDKEVVFEISYAASFHGDIPCENMIYTANRLTEEICTRRIKNMIITSGAVKPSEVRAPKDVLGIGYLLGLDETTARTCIREHSNRIVCKADWRKYGKTWVAFIPSPKTIDHVTSPSTSPTSTKLIEPQSESTNT